MKLSLMHQTVWIVCAVILGLGYYFCTQVEISDIKHATPEAKQFSFVVTSNLSQTIKLHIKSDRYLLESVLCGKDEVSFEKRERQWFEKTGQELRLYVQKGETRCLVKSDNSSRAYTPLIKQKMSYVDYTVLFILIGWPIFDLLFSLLVWSMNRLWRTGDA